MSKAPFMIDCPTCIVRKGTNGGIISSGIIERIHYGFNNKRFTVKDICDRCGGSGRIPAYVYEARGGVYRGMTLKFSKRHKVEMRKWLAMEKELLYGKVENLE